MDEITEGIKVFGEDASKPAVRVARQLVEDGKAVWILDPQCERVVGLVHADNLNLAYVVVYLTGSLVAAGGLPDFECSDEFDEMVYNWL